MRLSGVCILVILAACVVAKPEGGPGELVSAMVKLVFLGLHEVPLTHCVVDLDRVWHANISDMRAIVEDSNQRMNECINNGRDMFAEILEFSLFAAHELLYIGMSTISRVLDALLTFFNEPDLFESILRQANSNVCDVPCQSNRAVLIAQVREKAKFIQEHGVRIPWAESGAV